MYNYNYIMLMDIIVVYVGVFKILKILICRNS